MPVITDITQKTNLCHKTRISLVMQIYNTDLLRFEITKPALQGNNFPHDAHLVFFIYVLPHTFFPQPFIHHIYFHHSTIYFPY